MLTKIAKFVLTVALLTICKPQVSSTQFWQNPYTGSVSRARSSATGHQLGLGALGVSQGVVDAQTETEANGGIANGGTTSVANSRSRTAGVNFGGLGVGSTLTRSKTNTNGQVSRGLAHDVNVGGLGFGTSLSRDNLNKGFGVQRSQDGGLTFGLGLLNFDVGGKQQPQGPTQVQTQAQAQAQGENAFATADSNSATQSRQFGALGFARTQSNSNALSATNYGQTSASADGIARNTRSYGLYRKRRAVHDVFKLDYDASSRALLRPKRWISYVPFVYPITEAERLQHGNGPAFRYAGPNYDFTFPEEESANAQGWANNQNNQFEQQAEARSRRKQRINGEGFFQDNGVPSIGSNLATDGSSTHLSSVNNNQANSITHEGSQSQAVKNQQPASNANGRTTETETKDGKRIEAEGDSQSSSSNLTNANTMSYDVVSDPQADASSQALFQSQSKQNSGVQSNSNVSSKEGSDVSMTNTANSNASAFIHEEAFGHFNSYAETQAKSAAFSSFAPQRSANGSSRFRG